MSKEIKEYLEHKSNHTLFTKLAAAHAAMLKAGSDYDAALPPALSAVRDARSNFYRMCKEALEEKAAFSAAMMRELEKRIINDNLTKLAEVSRKPEPRPDISPEFAKMFVLDVRDGVDGP